MIDTTHGLPERVLEQAARAAHTFTCGGKDCWEGLTKEQRAIWVRDVRNTLTILRPALERQLLERMIEDADDVDAETSLYPVYPDGHESSVPLTLAEWLRTYLPTTTEGAYDHE